MLLLVSQRLKQAIKLFVPSVVYRPILNWWRRPPPVRWGTLRRLTPVSRVFGLDRGQPIDRYFIEEFLGRHADDIRGHVLEIGDNAYTRRFGGERVTKSDVLHAVEGNPKATIVADLSSDALIPSDSFDCIIFTQTLQYIYHVQKGIRTLYRILAPGGILLATFPGISQISRYDLDRWGDYWRFTALSAKRLFAEVFPPQNLTVETHGNVLTAIAFLHGLSTQDLKQEWLDYHDPDYELLVTVRAVKPQTSEQ